MTLAEMVVIVLANIKRPDKTTDAQNALLAETYAAHSLGTFDFDIVSTALTFDSASDVQNFDAVSAISTFREVQSIIVINADGEPISGRLKKADPGDVIDSYRALKTNCYFRIGNKITIRYQDVFQYVRMVYRKNPTLSVSGYASDIATVAPYYLIEMACAKLFGDIGKDAEAAAAARRAQRYAVPLMERLVDNQDLGD